MGGNFTKKGLHDHVHAIHEKIYDVAWSGDRKPGADGKLPSVGSTVDVKNATWTNTIGAPELIAAWKDPDFDRSQRAFYYGRDDYESQAGHRLADVIQSEVTAQLGLKDGRTHPKSLPLLRETRMPAVHLEPCFITNPHEELLLRSPTFRARFAGAVADALERFFRQGQDDAEEPLRHRDVERAR